MKGYREITLNDSRAPTYIKEDSVKALGRVDAMVFDCDGVLLDTRESYDICVKKTAEILIEALTGQKIVVEDDYLYQLRDTGGFNNDWDLTYTLIQYILSAVSRSQKELLCRIYEDSLVNPLYERYEYIRTETGKITADIRPTGFDSFVGELDSTGIKSLESLLSGVTPEFSKLVRQVLSYPGDISESMLTRIFEEYFCGSTLFMKIYGLPPIFTETPGLIYNEKVAASTETLEILSKNCDGRLGIASGSQRAQAETILGDLTEYFRGDATVWMDDVDEVIYLTGKKGLHKPNPYSLIRAADALQPYNRLLYLGDTMADLSMVLQSERDDILFAGVYATTGQGEKVLKGFMEREADIVTPSVNDIPQILEGLRGEMD